MPVKVVAPTCEPRPRQSTVRAQKSPAFCAASLPRRTDESEDKSPRDHDVTCLTRARPGALVRAAGNASGLAVAVLSFF
jgi:hypothetical protein